MSQITFSDLVNGTYPDASDFNTRYNALKNRINNGMEADNIADSAVTTAKINNEAVTYAKFDSQIVAGATAVTAASGDYAFISDVSDSNNVKKALVSDFFLPTATNALAGSVIQVVNVTNSARTTGTTLLPFDDTIPQNTEGDEYMTLAITPSSATNKLLIQAKLMVSHSTASNYIGMALFQDSAASALAATGRQLTASADTPQELILSWYMTTGTTSSTTFKIRAGCQAAGTTSVNNLSSARLFGGVASSYITISEIKV